MTFTDCRDALFHTHDELGRRLEMRTGLDRVREGSGIFFLNRPGMIAERVYVQVPCGLLGVTLYPCNTASQADSFQPAVDKDAFLGLHENGWLVEPALCFSFAGTKLIDCTTTWTTRQYFEHFFSGERTYGQLNFGVELSATLIDLWHHSGLISSRDKTAIERERDQTGRQSLALNPCFSVFRSWTLEELVDLEGQGRLEDRIIQELAVPLATWVEVLNPTV